MLFKSPILRMTEERPSEHKVFAFFTSSDHVGPAVKYQLELYHLTVGTEKSSNAAPETTKYWVRFSRAPKSLMKTMETIQLMTIGVTKYLSPIPPYTCDAKARNGAATAIRIMRCELE